ncbi:MAG TPA: hypothetical protein VGD74_10130 [Vulgatibacter sp.]
MRPIEPSEWELLSRLRDGELPEAERRTVLDALAERPELVAGLSRLDALDHAARSMADGLDPLEAEAIVSRVMASDRPPHRHAIRWMALAAAAASVAATYLLLQPGPEPLDWRLVGREGAIEAPASAHLSPGDAIRPAAPPERSDVETAVATRAPGAAIPAVEEVPEEPASMTREALVAEVVGLRHSREELLREKNRLTERLASIDSGESGGTYYRLGPEVLARAAASGTIRIRLPQAFVGVEEPWGDEAAAEVGLSQEEESALRAAYAESRQHIREHLRSIFVEIGGDDDSAREMDAYSLFTEIRAKSARGDLEAAIRLAARERAGLVPPGNDDAAVSRTFRLLWQEDDRTIGKVEEILGASRAERFLEHPAWYHSNIVLSAGKEPQPY